jgi:hypothetical protein
MCPPWEPKTALARSTAGAAVPHVFRYSAPQRLRREIVSPPTIIKENSLYRHGKGKMSGSFDYAPVIDDQGWRIEALRSG